MCWNAMFEIVLRARLIDWLKVQWKFGHGYATNSDRKCSLLIQTLEQLIRQRDVTLISIDTLWWDSDGGFGSIWCGIGQWMIMRNMAGYDWHASHKLEILNDSLDGLICSTIWVVGIMEWLIDWYVIARLQSIHELSVISRSLQSHVHSRKMMGNLIDLIDLIAATDHLLKTLTSVAKAATPDMAMIHKGERQRDQWSQNTNKQAMSWVDVSQIRKRAIIRRNDRR